MMISDFAPFWKYGGPAGLVVSEMTKEMRYEEDRDKVQFEWISDYLFFSLATFRAAEFFSNVLPSSSWML